MGHLQATTQRMASDEAYAAYGEADSASGSAPDGWKPAGPPLMAEPTEADLAALADDRPGAIIERHVGPIITDAAPLPRLGHMVVYHLREGDSRNRRSAFPAIVVDVDQEQRELVLMVIVDANDTWMQERVRERVAPEVGWERIPPDTLVEVPVDLVLRLSRQVFGDSIEEPGSILDRLRAIEHTVELLGKGAGVPAAVLTRLAAIEQHPALEIPPLVTAADVEAASRVSDAAKGVPDGRLTATTARHKRRRGGAAQQGG